MSTYKIDDIVRADAETAKNCADAIASGDRHDLAYRRAMAVQTTGIVTDVKPGAKVGRLAGVPSVTVYFHGLKPRSMAACRIEHVA